MTQVMYFSGPLPDVSLARDDLQAELIEPSANPDLARLLPAALRSETWQLRYDDEVGQLCGDARNAMIMRRTPFSATALGALLSGYGSVAECIVMSWNSDALDAPVHRQFTDFVDEVARQLCESDYGDVNAVYWRS